MEKITYTYVTFKSDMSTKNIRPEDITDPLELLMSKGRKGIKDYSLYREQKRQTRYERLSDKHPLPNYFKKIIARTNSKLNRMIHIMQNYKQTIPNPSEHYEQFEIPKQTGGVRIIDAPSDSLKHQQSNLSDFLRHSMQLLESEIAHGYVPGRSIVTNAKKHQNSNHFAKIDFADFFPTFTPELIYKIMSKISIFGLIQYDDTYGVENLYTKKLTIQEFNSPLDPITQEEIKIKEYTNKLRTFLKLLIDRATKDDYLPQGSPLSPLLTNVLMIPFDYHVIHDFAKHRKSTIVTRYVDDLSISSYYPFSERKSDKDIAKENLTEPLRKISEEYYDGALKIKDEKTRISTKEGKNRITGLKVNKDNQVTIGWREKRKLKRDLATAITSKKDGVDVPYAEEVLGYLSYLYSVEPDYARYIDETYRRKFNIRHRSLTRFFNS